MLQAVRKDEILFTRKSICTISVKDISFNNTACGVIHAETRKNMVIMYKVSVPIINSHLFIYKTIPYHVVKQKHKIKNPM